MKHIFVINPAAGKTNVTEALLPRLHALFVGREEELETYLTTGVGDATRFVKERCAASCGEHLRFYSCGGDGTMNEVLQGLAGCANAAMGVVPCGSGNDFVRSFPDCDFSNLEAQIAAEERPIDLIHFNNQWSANICSAGLDSDVCKNMARYKRLPLVTGSGAYILALISTFFSPMGKQAHIVLDDRRTFDRNRTIMPTTQCADQIFGKLDKGNTMIVAMIDYGTCDISNLSLCSESYIDGIRVIFKKHVMHEAIQFCHEVKKLGYKVFAQAVSITSYSDRELLDLVDLVNDLEPYAMSLVDTYGLLHQDNLLHYFQLLNYNLKPSIAIG